MLKNPEQKPSETLLAITAQKPEFVGSPVHLSLPKGFKFIEDAHQYFIGETEIPGFSLLLKEFGLVDDRYYTEFSRLRGKAIHRAIELDNQNDLNESTLDKRILPYLNAWRKFKDAEYVVPIQELVEKRICSANYQYGVTPDVPCYIGKTPAIIEIKSSASLPWWVRLQLAAQQIALQEVTGMIFPWKIALRLSPDGSYQKKDDFGPNDREDFLSLVRAYSLKKEKR